MIFNINQDVLLDAINIIQRGLPQKTPLPILNGIKLEVLMTTLFLHQVILILRFKQLLATLV